MSLEETVAQIKEDLRKGQFPNEASVSQGVVLPILKELEWPVFNTSVVAPQYKVEGTFLDFALCNTGKKPVVSLEVKQVGKADTGEGQLFQYVFRLGVALAVLTDGQEWNFYLTYGQGDYKDRRVYKLDLLERELPECCYRFRRYLTYNGIIDNTAIESVRADYEAANRQNDIQKTLPLAWKQLLEEADETVVELLSSKVEDMCGYQPDLEVCASYLSGLSRSSLNPSRPDPAEPKSSSAGPRKPLSNVTEVGFTLHGQFHRCRNATWVMRKLFEALAGNDVAFPDRFAARKHGTKRRYLAKTMEELYPGRPDLCDSYSIQLDFGWYLGTNYNKPGKEKIIKLACEVASLQFDEDVIVNLG